MRHTIEIKIPDDAILGPVFIVTYFRDDGLNSDNNTPMILAGATLQIDTEGLKVLGSTKEDWIRVVKNMIDGALLAGGN